MAPRQACTSNSRGEKLADEDQERAVARAVQAYGAELLTPDAKPLKTTLAEQVAEIKLFNEIIFSLSRAAALTEPLSRSPIPALKWDVMRFKILFPFSMPRSPSSFGPVPWGCTSSLGYDHGSTTTHCSQHIVFVL